MKLYDAYGRIIRRGAGFGATYQFLSVYCKAEEGNLSDAIGYEVPDDSETERSYDNQHSERNSINARRRTRT
jgi:hypothetical protein